VAAATSLAVATAARGVEEPIRCVVVELFVDGAQAESQAALAAAERFAGSRRGVHLVVRQAGLDVPPEARGRQRLQQLAAHFQFDPARLPVAYCCNQAIGPERLLPQGGAATAAEGALAEALRLCVYVRTGCSRCAAAKQMLAGLLPRYPGMELVFIDIAGQPSSAAALAELARRYRTSAASVPAFHFCNQLTVGFDAANTAARLEQVLQKWTAACPAESGAAAAREDGAAAGVVQAAGSSEGARRPPF
jgi:hypothetical protein